MIYRMDSVLVLDGSGTKAMFDMKSDDRLRFSTALAGAGTENEDEEDESSTR